MGLSIHDQITNILLIQNPSNWTEQKHSGSQVWTASHALLVATGKVTMACAWASPKVEERVGKSYRGPPAVPSELQKFPGLQDLSSLS